MEQAAEQLATPTDLISKVINNRYELIEFIGAGMTSRVYKATDRKLNAVVAVKLLSPHLNADPVSVERFRREAQITRMLNHAQVVTVSDIVTENNQLALIMDFAEGLDLKEFIRQNSPLPVEMVISVVRQLLQVIAVCHSRDIVHRDLKPQNIVVGKDGRIRLLDFGIARMTSLTDITQTGTTLGTPEYMAPELFAASSFDPRTDLYAIGVICYEMLTGVLPYQGDSIAVLYTHHLDAKVPDPADVRSEVPQWLSDFTKHCLAKQPHERYQTAEEALRDLMSQRVLLKSYPECRKVICYSCGQDTIEPVLSCLHCGNDRARLFKKSGPGLKTTDSTDLARLKQFLITNLRINAKDLHIGKDQLIVANLTDEAISVLKTAAMKKHVYLQNVDTTVDLRFKYLILLVPLSLVLFSMLKSVIFRSFWSYQLLGSVCCLLVGSWVLHRLRRVTPVLKEQHLAWLTAQTVSMPAAVRKVFAAPCGHGGAKDTLRQLIQKFVLIGRSGFADTAEVKQHLNGLLTIAAEIATTMGEIQEELNKFSMDAALSMLETAAADAAAVTTHAEKQKKESEYATVHALVTRHQAFEDAVGRLNRKLIRIHAAFNTVIGRTYIDRIPLNHMELADLRGVIIDLKAEQEVAITAGQR